jgi:hypothetical protein
MILGNLSRISLTRNSGSCFLGNTLIHGSLMSRKKLELVDSGFNRLTWDENHVHLFENWLISS